MGLNKINPSSRLRGILGDPADAHVKTVSRNCKNSIDQLGVPHSLCDPQYPRHRSVTVKKVRDHRVPFESDLPARFDFALGFLGRLRSSWHITWPVFDLHSCPALAPQRGQSILSGSRVFMIHALGG